MNQFISGNDDVFQEKEICELDPEKMRFKLRRKWGRLSKVEGTACTQNTFGEVQIV